MANFYDEWLSYWDDAKEERARARKAIQQEELEWVRTQQDWRAALLCSPQNGFVTAGNVMLADIPKNYHTGKHSHGEEGMYILEGEGFSVIDDKRYDWDAGSCLFIPFGAVHQHYNTGSTTARYLSAMSLPLERFAGLARIVQYEEAGETPLGKLEVFERAESEVHPEYGRIVLRAKDAEISAGERYHRRLAEAKNEFHESMAKEMKMAGTPAHRSGIVHLMDQENGFKAREVNITAILMDEPHKNSGRHGHMEAVLYVLDGEGYTIVDGERVDWKKGSLIQVPGPDSVHQHFNTGDVVSRQLRIHYGLRSHFFQAIAKRVFPYVYYEFSVYGDH
ncbi:MAG: cupin domain-containing protein [Chloroflexi bacterium]|nr:cupin domain-containing protein [Chloroflexota bacterium]